MDEIDELFILDEPSTSDNKRKHLDKESEEDLNKFLEEAIKEEEAANEQTEVPLVKKLHTDLLDVENLSYPRIKIHTLQTKKGCIHELCLPPYLDYTPLQHSDKPPAKEYSFTLDPFQKEAILCLTNEQSVLVSAHTSAGKTVIAEYAIAMSLNSNRRVIYTTPIKALSNQKYREFYEEFKDVGLLTGDATVNASASCLIMTTEILRSMLYRGSDIMREVQWVIFDEIHYMRDKERGVVWEETIILLPDAIRFVFLSATIPNALQFAQWVCHLHHQPCHVVSTDYRPVPLEQYIFPTGGKGLYLVVDKDGAFREQIFNKAMDAFQLEVDKKTSGPHSNKFSKGSFQGRSNKSCFEIIQLIMERQLAPVIVFSFSKKECEAYAIQLAKLDFNSEGERQGVTEIFNNAIHTLTEEDRKLPQVISVLPFLQKGIGIHHSGLLPILKETVEILFGEGLIKVLFATETFAMGLNMPARTVMFTSVRKFDGKDMRYVTSGEFIQMSGRAGRRGLDDKGTVILMIDEKMTPTDVKTIIMGEADPINSAFRLTYNMILNLMRVDDINPEFMLEKSFYQFQNYALLPDLSEKLKVLVEEYKSLDIANENQVNNFFGLKEQMLFTNEEIHKIIIKPENIIPVIVAGRLVEIRDKSNDFSWGVIVDKPQTTIRNIQSKSKDYIVKVLLNISKECLKNPAKSVPRPPKDDEEGEMTVVPVTLESIKNISQIRICLDHDLTVKENREKAKKIIKSVKKKYPNGIPLLHPIDDMEISDENLQDLLKAKAAYEERFKTHSLYNNDNLSALKDLYDKKTDLENQIKEIKSKIKHAKSVLQMDELKCRKRILRRLNYCTHSDLIEKKGQVACEISAADELLVTELIVAGIFKTLNVSQVTALLSCFVVQEKSSTPSKLTEELSGPLREMQKLARKIAQVTSESNVEIDEKKYVDSFKPHLMDVLYSWSKGSSFATVCKMTDIFEGTIIRCIRHLEELLRQLVQASKSIGDPEMEKIFVDSIKSIKRDIAFSPSLYL